LLLSIFFAAGAVISFPASISLIFPNSFLGFMWRLNPRAQASLITLGIWAVVLMFVVSVSCAAAAIGLWRGSRWGHRVAVGLIAINLVGDLLNTLRGIEPRAIIGVPIAGAILMYLLSRKVRMRFNSP
jgi:uncharacterized membrane protein (DUF2068 family)